MVSEAAKTVEPFTVVITAAELPQRILDRFSNAPPADAEFAITVEPATSEQERLEALKNALDVGVADLAAGRISEGRTVFERLKARFPVA